MTTCIPNVRLSALAAALPHRLFELSTLSEQFGEKEVNRIMASTGIRTVRVASSNERCSDLCYVAAKQIMRETDLAPQDCDAIIFVSQTPDQMLPARVQLKIGVKSAT
ncbi:MAG: hypothetical protein AAGB12_15545 [Pseudomonadota bacterium]